jgi:hypothetical protein
MPSSRRGVCRPQPSITSQLLHFHKKEALSNGVIPETTQRCCVGIFDELIGMRSDCVCQNAFSVTEIGPRDEARLPGFSSQAVVCGVGGALIERRPLLHRQDQGSPVPARANVQVCYGNERTDGYSIGLTSLKAAIATDPGNIWMQPRGVIAKVEWHPGAFYPRVGFTIT